MSAPEIGAPVESTTLPRMVPTCACTAVVLSARVSRNGAIRAANRLRRIRPPGRCAGALSLDEVNFHLDGGGRQLVRRNCVKALDSERRQIPKGANPKGRQSRRAPIPK